MDPGRLDRRIVIQVSTPAQSSSGEVTDSWGTLATLWAEFLPGPGRESFSQDQRHAHVDARFRIWWRDDVSPLNRITYDGRAYDIVEVLEVGRREGLELRATTRAE